MLERRSKLEQNLKRRSKILGALQVVGGTPPGNLEGSGITTTTTTVKPGHTMPDELARPRASHTRHLAYKRVTRRYCVQQWGT